MKKTVEALLIVTISVSWTTFLFWTINRQKKKLIAQKLPLRLAYYSLIWAIAVIVSILTWSRLKGNENSESLGSKSWFNVGYKTGLSFFTISIDTWYKYAVIVNYQITRSIIGSLLSNVFRPFMTSEVQSKMHNKSIDRSQTIYILLAQASVTIFGFTSTITDLFLYLSQVDISIISLVITLISDAASTSAVLQAGASKCKNAKEILETIETRETEPLALRKQRIKV